MEKHLWVVLLLHFSFFPLSSSPSLSFLSHFLLSPLFPSIFERKNLVPPCFFSFFFSSFHYLPPSFLFLSLCLSHFFSLSLSLIHPFFLSWNGNEEGVVLCSEVNSRLLTERRRRERGRKNGSRRKTSERVVVKFAVEF